MDERLAFLTKMAADRKFISRFQQVMALADFEYLRRSNELAEVAYLKEGRLGRKTKELLFVALSTVKGTDRDHLKMHMRAAIDAGATAEDILEVLELLSLPMGMMSFRFGMDAWIDVFNPPALTERSGE